MTRSPQQIKSEIAALENELSALPKPDSVSDVTSAPVQADVQSAVGNTVFFIGLALWIAGIVVAYKLWPQDGIIGSPDTADYVSVLVYPALGTFAFAVLLALAGLLHGQKVQAVKTEQSQ